MSHLYPYCKHIDLHVEGRITREDAARQERTAREILRRLSKQPGVILADEVGMGKTFVALAVAVSTALENRKRRPVVVMVPSSLKSKWPIDFELFRERCLPGDLAERVRYGRAERAVEFLKLLDDPAERRRSIIFITHGAMSRGLADKWVMLALMCQALKGRWGGNELRKYLARFAGELLARRHIDEEVWLDLLKSHPSQWLQVLQARGVDPEADNNPDTDDDPVPRQVWEALPKLPKCNLDAIYRSLDALPRRRSKYFKENLRGARRVIKQELREVWKVCIRRLKMKLPLLVLDEAHHLKNPQTYLASLFQDEDAARDADEVSRGPLAGVFERMLFLTATPFQLGHMELCSVLQRFTGIDWRGRLAPSCGREGFERQMRDLRTALDAAQEAAVTLDTAWGHLQPEDLKAGESVWLNVSQWWEKANTARDLSPAAARVLKCYDRTQQEMKTAEQLLRPWVIRHLKPRVLPEPHHMKMRRRVLRGKAISNDDDADGDAGIPVAGECLLPFLLAARAASQAPESRPVFAEGLASSYEAFLDTRSMPQSDQSDEKPGDLTDIDDDAITEVDVTDAMHWYLDQLEHALPRQDPRASASHPKIAATIQRVLDIWEAGEKAVVFCHYIATGRGLRQRISEALQRRISLMAAEKLKCSPEDATLGLERIGRRFFDEDSPIRRASDAEVANVLREFPGLEPQREALIEVVRRNVRTPSFLVRFFSLAGETLREEDMAEAMDKPDRSGLTLRVLLRDFFHFLVERCGEAERLRYIDAVSRIQTGSHVGTDVAATYSTDELQGAEADRLIPNVRLVNGKTGSETRQRLMLTFNTPFYPEILVASSVMAEGVDLHLNCRYVIHHDLCWNPSTLEQRTGRIDRIGAKVERCGEPIHVYLPFIAATQDEKQYRVVMDRERWFSVVMGEEYRMDLKTTERLAERIPFPESAASKLAFRLEVVGAQRPTNHTV